MEERKNCNILVTGGGGFLGSAIARLLTQRGDRVSSFSRGYYPALEKSGIKQIKGDIRDKDAVDKACKGMDMVFHVAAKPGVWGKYSEYYGINVTGTLNIVAACQKSGVRSLIYTSSPSVVFDNGDMEGADESAPYPSGYRAHYPKTKAIAERHVAKASNKGLRTIIMRPHLIWGPGDNHLVPRIIARAKKLAQVGNGRNKVDTIYIDNAAKAHILAADNLEKNQDLSGNIYFISQDSPIPLWDMVNAILEAGSLSPVKRSVPKGVAWLAGSILELAYALFRIDNEPQMTRFVAEELASSHWFNIDAAKKDLGYVPEVSTEEGLRRLKAYLESSAR